MFFSSDWLAGLLALAVLAAGAFWWKHGLAEMEADGKGGTPAIIDRPIPFGAKRQTLTLDYIREHYDPAAQSIRINPRMIVIHWTGSHSMLSALATFHPESLPFWRKDILRAGRVNVSAHFLVDRDGNIYRLMPERWMARHVVGLNPLAMGIENTGGPKYPLTDAQLRSNAGLVRYLAGKYPEVKYLIGHHEYGRFRGTPLWRERDPNYFPRKQDPGDAFMRRLRTEVAELGLEANYRGANEPP